MKNNELFEAELERNPVSADLYMKYIISFQRTLLYFMSQEDYKPDKPILIRICQDNEE